MTTSPRPSAQADANAGRAAGGPRDLWPRIASACVLAPIVLAAAFRGGWVFLVLCVLGATAILWEWSRLVTGRSDPRILAPGCPAIVAAFALCGLDEAASAAIAVAVGAALAGAFGSVGVALAREQSGQPRRLWAAGGVVYAGVAFLGPALLRRDAELGFRAILFLAATVWMTDICAYFVGRALRGPLLWPQISPNKTWAGACGGLAGGVAGGGLVAYAGGTGSLVAAGAIALLLSVLAQAGDLFESGVKRYFGVKDTSRLIPGHGGVMDRLDGFLVAALGALLIGLLHQGIGAPARGLLVW